MYKDKIMGQDQAMATEEDSGVEGAIPETKYGKIGFDKAIKFLYGDKLKEVTTYLKGARPGQIPKRLADVVNVAITSLEQEGGEPMPIELAAEVGFRLMDALQEDMVGDEVMPELTDEELAQSISILMSDYANSHPDVVSPEQFHEFLGQLQSQSGDPNQDPLGQAQPEGVMAQEAMPTQPQPQPQPQPQQQGLLGA